MNRTTKRNLIKLVYIILGIVIIVIIGLCIINNIYNNNKKIRRSISPNKRKDILMKLYNTVLDIASSCNVKIFLLYGTLLGKIRNNDLICYDYDIDLGILINDFNKLVYYIQKYFKNSNDYSVNIIDFLYYKEIKVIHNKTKLNLDIDIFDNDIKNVWKSKPYLETMFILNECSSKLPINCLLPLKKTIFLGKKVYLPNKPNCFLSCAYGETYMIPNHECNSDCTICTEK